MKKSISTLIIFLFLSSAVIAATVYPDVAKDHANFKAIEFLDIREVVSGYPDGTFKPDNLVNRAEAMKMIVGAFDLKTENANYITKYPDVKEDAWFFSYVMTGDGKKIVEGYPDGTFKPAQTVNLAETLKMVSLASGIEVADEVVRDVFADVKKEMWFSPYMQMAKEKNILLADDFGKVMPDQAMTRARFAEIVYRVVTVMENNGEAFDLAQNWDFYESEKLPFKIKYPEGYFKVTDKDDEVVFLRPDLEFAQSKEQRIYPNTARMKVSVDKNENKLLAVQYFENLRNGFAQAAVTNFDFDGLEALEVSIDRAVDWYIYLEDGRVLVVFTDYGDGILEGQLQNYLKAMLKTLEYVPKASGVDYSDLKSDIFKVILVSGKGQEMIDRLPDALIIETDTIGVGKGPVDYYYSEALEMTIKFERNSSTILDTRSLKTSSF